MLAYESGNDEAKCAQLKVESPKSGECTPFFRDDDKDNVRSCKYSIGAQDIYEYCSCQMGGGNSGFCA